MSLVGAIMIDSITVRSGSVGGAVPGSIAASDAFGTLAFFNEAKHSVQTCAMGDPNTKVIASDCKMYLTLLCT